MISGVSQSFPQSVYSRAYAVLKVDKRLGGPERLTQHLAGGQFSGPFQQDFQDLKRVAW
jgi:hypothetical protein